MLPDYTIRESVRAKHVRFKVSLADGLVVVIPKGFDRRRIPALIDEKRRWIDRALKQVEAHRAAMPSPDARPEEISLPSIGRTWLLEWHETNDPKIRIGKIDASRLRLSGPIDDRDTWRVALRKWLLARGREVLVPRAQALADELGVRIERVTIRCQKTRWGSYTARRGQSGTISLNAQLLFLPERLVRFILLHEICHARYPNHSASFWDLVRAHEPDTDRLRAELRGAWKHVPRWITEARR